MGTKKCAVCEKSVEQTPGKKEKRYCSPICRQRDWQKKRREEIAVFRGKGGIPIPAGYVEMKNISIISQNKAIPATKPEKPAESTQKKQEAPKEAINGPTKTVGIGVVRSPKYFDTLIRESTDKLVLEALREDLAVNEIVPADKKKEFNNRIDFKLKRL